MGKSDSTRSYCSLAVARNASEGHPLAITCIEPIHYFEHRYHSKYTKRTRPIIYRPPRSTMRSHRSASTFNTSMGLIPNWEQNSSNVRQRTSVCVAPTLPGVIWALKSLLTAQSGVRFLYKSINLVATFADP
jgi:hypothetical protein